MTSLFNLLRRLWLAAILLAPCAHAHDPFDGNTDVRVFDDRLEVTITLGYDAARELATQLGLPPEQQGRVTATRSRELVSLPAAAAARLVQLSANGSALPPRSFVAAPGDVEIPFRVVYARPATDGVQLRAAYFHKIDYMRPGALVVSNAQRRIIATAMLTSAKPQAAFPLTLTEGETAIAGAHGFADFFRLGVEHILTGFDHLLFLAALLLAVRKIKPMLIIVTAFTAAHSVTLALAAFDLVVLPSRVVEPLIAASIIVVGLENMWRRDATADRYWLAGVFGLIHGFGFAGLLRETLAAGSGSGSGIVVPLMGFNLGVEAGQLLVAALVVPLLLLLRRHARFERYGVPALSAVVIVVSTLWLWQRLAG